MKDPGPANPQLIVGLEVHVQLATESKLFCTCSTRFGQPSNSQVCPVCLGLPGSLPVANRRAIDLTLLAALALQADVAAVAEWDRKQYFYPDLPKGYQISQLRHPLCGAGEVVFDAGERNEPVQPVTVRIDHAHLEEDAGKSLHDVAGPASGRTAVDFNRAGTPLLEIVTRPDLTSGRQARLFLSELRQLLVWNGITDGNMQEGSLRCDANVNLAYDSDAGPRRTPVSEIKNLNSLRAVERAIDAESARQWELVRAGDVAWLSGGKQTRGWDDTRGVSTLQREKEAVADYRYLPEADLPPLAVGSDWVEKIRPRLVDSPQSVRTQLQEVYGLSPYDSRVIVAHSREAVGFFRSLADRCGNPKQAANWVQQDVFGYLAASGTTLAQYPVAAEDLGDLLRRVENGELPGARAREVLAEAIRRRCDLTTALSGLDVSHSGIDAIVAACVQAIERNPAAAADVRAGKMQALGPLIGMVRKEVPNADPAAVKRELQRLTDVG